MSVGGAGHGEQGDDQAEDEPVDLDPHTAAVR